MTDTITLPRYVVEKALEALKIGHESAHDCAETFHIEMAGYKQQRHEALDAEVKQISDAIGALRAALEQPQVEQKPNPRWPSNASEVRAFLSGRVATERYACDDHQPDDNDTYTLSAHDLLEAIDWWTDFDLQPRQPLTVGQINRLIADGKLPLSGNPYEVARAIERAHGIGSEA